MKTLCHCLAAAALALTMIAKGEDLAAQQGFLNSLTNTAVDLAESGELEQALALFQQAAGQTPDNGKVGVGKWS